MPTLSVDSFRRGLDHRRLAAVSGADTLQEATNVYVNKGGQIVRRPPLIHAARLSAGLLGLVAAGGKLHLFHDRTPAPANPDAALFTLHRVAVAGKTLAAIVYGAPFWRDAGSRLYVAALYTNGAIDHWLCPMDGSAGTQVVSEGGADTAGVAVAASRVFAVDGGVVRYSKVGNPADWSGTGDAGFLPVGRAAGGRENATALGLYDEKLVVFFPDALQVWAVDEDPDNHRLVQHVEGAGTRYPRSVAQIGGHTIFLADDGYRLLDTQPESQRIITREVGSPIDTLVEMRGDAVLSPDDAPTTRHPGVTGVFWPALDQYLCFWGLRSADVYSYSRQDRLAAWTGYELTAAVRDVAVLGRRLYLRAHETDDLYRMEARPATEQLWRDATVAPPVAALHLADTAAHWAQVFTGAFEAPWYVYNAALAVQDPAPSPQTGAVIGVAGYDTFTRWVFPIPDSPLRLPPNLPSSQVAELRPGVLGEAGTTGRSLFIEYLFLSHYFAGFYLQVDVEFTTTAAPAPGLPDETVWRTLGYLPAIPYNDQYSHRYSWPGLVDFANNPVEEFSAAGGWRQLGFELPKDVARVRLSARITPQSFGYAFLRLEGLTAAEFCLRRVTLRPGSGAAYRSRVVLPYLDAQRPGVAKQWQGARLVQEGSCDLSFRYRVGGAGAGAEVRETRPRRARGDERPAPLKAVGLVSRDLAPVCTVLSDTPWTLGAVELELQYLNAWA